MKIFYSWQSDTPYEVNRGLIKSALNGAITKLNAEIALSESERADGPLELDHDTKDVLGSPNIVDTILGKLRTSDVVVSDVTLVAEGRETKKHINSNVAIELGYLLGTQNDKPLLTVMNTAFGSPEGLPFDLQGRRFPVTFNVPAEAGQDLIETETKKLAKKFTEILKLYVNEVSKADQSPVERHERQSSTYIESAYWEIDKPIGSAYRSDKSLFCSSTHLISVRVIPELKQVRLNSLECKDYVANIPPLLIDSYSTSQNRWGEMTYNTYHGQDAVMSGTQVFKSREIWMFAEGLIWQHRADDSDNADWFIGHETIMRYLPDAIGNAVHLGQQLIAGSSMIVLTAANLTGVFVRSGEANRPRKNPISETAISVDRPLSDALNPNEFAFEFAKRIYAEAGIHLDERIKDGQIS